MDKRKKDSGKASVESAEEYVTVAFAEDVELAQHYKRLLTENEIPAAVKRCPQAKGAFSDIAVMVPEGHIEEAYAVISSQIDYEDFFELAFNDDQMDDDADFSENIF